jgi:large subunit ribosomal protein L5
MLLQEISLLLPVSLQFLLVLRNRYLISNLREGMTIGARVTLQRHSVCTSSLIALFQWHLPRVRDFRGINDKSFDGRGNYSMGITEQIIFPEIDLDKVSQITGMDITFVTTAKYRCRSYGFVESNVGMPSIQKSEKQLIITYS